MINNLSKQNFFAVWPDRTNPGQGFGCRWQQSIKCFKSLQIKKHHNGVFLVGLKGFEPLTFALEGHCSIQLSYKPKMNGAGEGNRTLATSLEGWGSTTELHPHIFFMLLNSNILMCCCQQFFAYNTKIFFKKIHIKQQIMR